jgi:hypothetical protein
MSKHFREKSPWLKVEKRDIETQPRQKRDWLPQSVYGKSSKVYTPLQRNMHRVLSGGRFPSWLWRRD